MTITPLEENLLRQLENALDLLNRLRKGEHFTKSDWLEAERIEDFRNDVLRQRE